MPVYEPNPLVSTNNGGQRIFKVLKSAEAAMCPGMRRALPQVRHQTIRSSENALRA